jgi:hypothetical protein
LNVPGLARYLKYMYRYAGFSLNFTKKNGLFFEFNNELTNIDTALKKLDIFLNELVRLI